MRMPCINIKFVEEITRILYVGGSKNGKSEEVPMVFISYQWDIQEKVLKLKEKLEAKKITCWMDTGKMMGGDHLKAEIDKGIRGCKVSGTCNVIVSFFWVRWYMQTRWGIGDLPH